MILVFEILNINRKRQRLSKLLFIPTREGWIIADLEATGKSSTPKSIHCVFSSKGSDETKEVHIYRNLQTYHLAKIFLPVKNFLSLSHVLAAPCYSQRLLPLPAVPLHNGPMARNMKSIFGHSKRSRGSLWVWKWIPSGTLTGCLSAWFGTPFCGSGVLPCWNIVKCVVIFLGLQTPF